jgi:hypothetical protein
MQMSEVKTGENKQMKVTLDCGYVGIKLHILTCKKPMEKGNRSTWLV